MAKNNIMSNIDIDMALALNGITIKACDFEDDNNVKTMTHRRHHTTAEKKTADAKWRAKYTGKKNGRSREDYKVAKEMNEEKWSFRSYSRGGYDRNGIIQNRRYNEAMEDAMKNADTDDWRGDVNTYISLIEAKESLECNIRKLELEVDEVAFMDYQFRKWAMEAAKTHGFKFRPRVKVDSYAEEALGNARASLAEIEEDIDKLRRGVRE